MEGDEDDIEGSRETPRVLWLGEPSVLPAAGVDLGDGLAFAVTDGPADLLDQVPLRLVDGEGLSGVHDAVRTLLAGTTSRVGGLLAGWGVQYVAVVERGAAAPYTAVESPAPDALLASLHRQLDLERVEGLNRAVAVFANPVAEPVHAVVRDRTGRAVPVDLGRPGWGRLEATTVVAGSYRAAIGPEGWWRIEDHDGEAEPVEDGAPVLATARVDAGDRLVLVLDDDRTSTGSRTRQLAILALAVLATSWAHLGRARPGLER